MKKIIAALSVQLVLAAATPALARAHHHGQAGAAPYGRINSGWGAPSSWSDIEISHPEGGG